MNPSVGYVKDDNGHSLRITIAVRPTYYVYRERNRELQINITRDPQKDHNNEGLYKHRLCLDGRKTCQTVQVLQGREEGREDGLGSR